MDTPQFYDGQFVNGLLLDNAMAAVASGIADIGVSLHTPGLLNPSDLVFTPSGLTVQISAPSPFAVLFSSGFLSQAYGTVAGEVTSTYSVNLSSFVPGSGTQTVYIVAEHLQIGEELVTVVGPPQGHPDYDPAFNPFEAYSVDRDTISIVATTTAPDNETAIELFRVTLTVGQVTITSGQIITSHQVYASAVLDPTGVVSGTYVGATVSVGVDGRVTGVSGVAYGPLASANTWTALNTFTNSVTVDGTLTVDGDILVPGGSDNIQFGPMNALNPTGTFLSVENDAGGAAAQFCANTSAFTASVKSQVQSTNCALMAFYFGSSKVGSITTDTAVTAYNTSSDERIKTNIVAASYNPDWITEIMVREYEYIFSPGKTHIGAVAQELVFVAPEAVTIGDADPFLGPGDDGFHMWGVDASKLVWRMIQELQQQRARIEFLESNLK